MLHLRNGLILYYLMRHMADIQPFTPYVQQIKWNQFVAEEYLTGSTERWGEVVTFIYLVYPDFNPYFKNIPNSLE